MTTETATAGGVWGELVGQDRAVAILQRAVADPAAMTHAWLITGPPGSGRSNAARAFAAALQCPTGGCGQCQVCHSVAAGTNPDVQILKTDKVVISIDEVRDLVTTAGRSPVGGRYRVIIVEDADRMIERTTNVLLKAIEEPSPRTVWILCAPSPMDVLVTIRSRCRAVSLQVPDPRAVADLIVRRDGVSPDVALHAARAAWSHIGRARRLANDPAVAQQRVASLRAILTMQGVAGAVRLAGELVQTAKDEAGALSEETEAKERADLLTALGAQDLRTLPPAIRSQVRHLEEDQKRRRRRREIDTVDQLLIDVAGLFRDVLTTALDAQVDTLNSMIEDDIAAAATRLGPTAAMRALDEVALARTRIAGNVTPLLAFEALLVSIAEPQR